MIQAHDGRSDFAGYGVRPEQTPNRSLDCRAADRSRIGYREAVEAELGFLLVAALPDIGFYIFAASKVCKFRLITKVLVQDLNSAFIPERFPVDAKPNSHVISTIREFVYLTNP